MSPQSDAEYGGEKTTADPLAELDALEGRMRAFGLATASTTASSEDAVDRPAASPEDEDEDMGAGGDIEFEVGADQARDEAPEPATAPSGPDDSASFNEDPASHCGDLCDLSESICMLEVRICGLSESHASDPIYADACERAVDDCHTAGQACDGCED